MKATLAQRLLAEVMRWDATTDSTERPLLQALASFKYDEYQQYSPGMRFMESLAVWLNQFETSSEKHLAYSLIKEKLLYFSNIEILHLVSHAFPDVIRPVLIRDVAKEMGVPPYYVNRIVSSKKYKVKLRKSLFLGLSDGARLDALRRRNPILSNEQVVLTYELPETKRESLLEDLRSDIDEEDAHFEHLFLLDDFTASGTSYIRSETGKVTGKIWKALKKCLLPDETPLFKKEKVEIHLVIYIGTSDAFETIRKRLEELDDLDFEVNIHFVQKLPADCCISCSLPEEEFLQKYFDPSIVDKHWEKAAQNEKPYLGYNQCALPVVLSHNTPNNSIPILWFSESHQYRGLFPRVTRHK